MNQKLEQEVQSRGRWPHRWVCRWKGHQPIELLAEWQERTPTSDWHVQTDSAGTGCSRCRAAWIHVVVVPSTDERPVDICDVSVTFPR